MWHFIKHFMTITRHRHKVMYHCLRCGILWQGMRHDLSKYSPTEFLPGARFTSMHPNTAKLLEGWLMMLQQEGEEKTFAYIKNLK